MLAFLKDEELIIPAARCSDLRLLWVIHREEERRGRRRNRQRENKASINTSRSEGWPCSSHWFYHWKLTCTGGQGGKTSCTSSYCSYSFNILHGFKSNLCSCAGVHICIYIQKILYMFGLRMMQSCQVGLMVWNGQSPLVRIPEPTQIQVSIPTLDHAACPDSAGRMRSVCP